jgi:ribosomal protein L32E
MGNINQKKKSQVCYIKNLYLSVPRGIVSVMRKKMKVERVNLTLVCYKLSDDTQYMCPSPAQPTLNKTFLKNLVESRTVRRHWCDGYR